MRKKRWFGLAALLWLVAGCCDHPEIFQKVQGSLETVQSFYGPLIQQDLSQNEQSEASRGGGGYHPAAGRRAATAVVP